MAMSMKHQTGRRIVTFSAVLSVRSGDRRHASIKEITGYVFPFAIIF
jgi:hypothetical protein